MRRLIAASIAALALLTAVLPGAAARSFPDVIPLPGATSAEGIATGTGSTFFAGDLFTGSIFRGDLRTGRASLFIQAPAGRNALGMKVDVPHHLLFVAGGFTGKAFVYDTRTGADVAVLTLADASSGAIINDVVVANGAAWFTDSAHPAIYRVRIGAHGSIGAVTTLTVTGPAAGLTGDFNLNGIAASPNGRTLIVAHTGDGTLYTVNEQTGASAPIAGASVPNVDGILLEAGRLWAVQNTSNQVSEFTFSQDLASVHLVKVVTNPRFEVPTTIARDGSRLAVVNAKFDTGFPPTATSFEAIVFRR